MTINPAFATGAKLPIQSPPNSAGIPAAVLSPCKKYRYVLSRELAGEGSGVCVFIMLNPSTADHEVNDATIEKCMRYGFGWGYKTLVVLNLFAFRETSPEKMLKADDPVGPDNLMHIRATLNYIWYSGKKHVVVLGWGNDAPANYANEMIRLLNAGGYALHYLKMNQTGAPAHPLYLKGNLQPLIWRWS